MAKKKFERTKPHVNVARWAHIDHEQDHPHRRPSPRSSLPACPAPPLTPFDQIDKAPETSRASAASPSPLAHVEYETSKRHYAHVDMPATPPLRQEHDHRRRPGRRGHPRRRGDRRTAMSPRPAEHVLLARQSACPYIVVALTKGRTRSMTKSSSSSSRWRSVSS